MISAEALTLTTAIVTPVGLIAVATINYMTSRRAMKDAQAAQAAAKNAEAATAKAALQAAGMEQRQIVVAKEASAQLSDIAATTHQVHTIVNSQHTKLLQLVANLTARVAVDNPHDQQAQADARAAAESVGTNLLGVEVSPLDWSKP